MALIVSDRRTLVVGLGQTGLSCARFLHARGRDFAVADSREQPPGLDTLRRECPETEVFLGPFDPERFSQYNELIVSPGVARSEPAIVAAEEAGAQIRGDVDLFAELAEAPIVAITGSNGKSTVTLLVGEMARDAGKKVAVGGNLGTPVLELLDPEAELYVLELSSFQLETTERLGAEVATVLNVSDDHMDRYPSRMAYFQAKHRIFNDCHYAVVNLDDPLSQPLMRSDMEARLFGMNRVNLDMFSTRDDDEGQWITYGLDNFINTRELKLQGQHNVSNALAALTIGQALGLPRESMADTLRRFEGLPHRCQKLCERHGVTWINDSKGTNVGATVAAIQSLKPKQGGLILIAGGDGKGADFAPLARAMTEHCKGVILIGKDAEAIAAALPEGTEYQVAESLRQAVQLADRSAVEGDTVLLSPACSSLDQYRNYEERGNRFAEEVKAL